MAPKRLPNVAQALVATQDSPRTSGNELQIRRSYTVRNLPSELDRLADVDIPSRVLGPWRASGGRRELRRALTEDERTAVALRASALVPALQGYDPKTDGDRVALALTDMYSSFATARREDESTVLGRIDTVRRVLVEFPAWAIEAACRSIQLDGVLRDGRRDLRWPPSDPELIAVIRQQLAPYRRRLVDAQALLEAKPQEPVKQYRPEL